MQNKGFVMTFAGLLALVCLFYLSFSVVTNHYENKAIELASDYASKNSNDDTELYNALYEDKYNSYLDSMSTEKVWLSYSDDSGFSLKECRERELGLGLDLKGGMSVIVEVDAAAVLRSLGNEGDAAFMEAINAASDENRMGSNSDYISIFVKKFKEKNGNDKLAGVFATKLRDQVQATDKDDHVVSVLREELQSVANNSFNVLRTRIDRFGVVAPNIQRLDRVERILIELPGIKEPERVRKLLQGSANLEFWKTYDMSEVQTDISRVDALSREALAHKNDSTIVDSLKQVLSFNKALRDCFHDVIKIANTGDERRDYIGAHGAIHTYVHKTDTATVNSILNKYKSQLPGDLQFAWGFKAEDQREAYFALYTLRGDGIKRGPALEGDVVVNASAEQGHNTANWEVSMQMNSHGTNRWASITGAETGRSIAIVLDEHVYSAPNVSGKIDGGRSQITGNFTVEDAKDLENVLKSGKMKAGVSIVQEDIVGPSLGQEAIDAGVVSFILAILILFAYMCLVYGIIPGMIANTALMINLFFTVGILAAFGAVLTLPGITGLVLTLAMAVDANVLIYERTKEELRAGKNVRTALMDGYKNAFSAIFDANVTTALTGFILAYFGTGAVQGFATTLIIGILVSFFTAVFMTRVFYEFMLNKGKFQNLTFTTKLTKNFLVNNNFDFLGKVKIAYVASATIIVAGIISLFTLGLNAGIDFTGGRNYMVRFEKTVNTTDVEQALIPHFEGATVRVLTSGTATQAEAASQVRITTNYKVEDPSDEVETEIRAKMTAALQPYLDAGKTIDDGYIQSSQRVGPSIADDLKKASTIAVVLAVLAMAVYILGRFRDIAFSVGTFVAIAHDAIVVILLYSLLYKVMPFSMEIDQVFIAAILTVVGYSINDKVVIFDRIRETRLLYPKREVTLTINDALNSTLGRTVNTSLSALVVVLCIFILGGDTIRSFTFAIFMGILIGTYSSLFIATPIAWHMLLRKEKKEVK